MFAMRQGDLVIRKSYGGDIVFRIQQATGHRALLKGIDYRLLADSPESDLSPFDPAAYRQRMEENQMRISRSVRQLDRFHRHQTEQGILRSAGGNKAAVGAFFEMPGKVLHLDGDYSYLQKSMALYKELRVPAVGYFVNEAGMAEAIRRILPQVKPDIVVLTGHDGILKDRKEKDIQNLTSYKNSHNFVNAVYTAREYERGKDNLIIVAGACQSHFEALLHAGANFASSPGRVLIHALDPLYIASKVSFTSIKDTVQIQDILHNTLSGLEGLGGVETRGCYRMGLPHVQWGDGGKEVKETV